MPFLILLAVLSPLVAISLWAVYGPRRNSAN